MATGIQFSPSMNETRSTQLIYDQMVKEHSSKFPEYEKKTEEFCGFITHLDRRNNCFIQKKIVNIPTQQEFGIEKSGCEETIRGFLSVISQAKNLQQDCLVTADYLKPPLVADSIELVKETNPQLHEAMKKDYEICQKHFTEITKYEKQTKELVDEMEKKSKDARSALLTFNHIADNKGTYQSGIFSGLYNFVVRPAISRTEILKKDPKIDKDIKEVITELQKTTDDVEKATPEVKVAEPQFDPTIEAKEIKENAVVKEDLPIQDIENLATAVNSITIEPPQPKASFKQITTKASVGELEKKNRTSIEKKTMA